MITKKQWMLCCLVFIMGCSTPPIIKEVGWYGEALPAGLKRRLKILPKEPAFRNIDGQISRDPLEAKEYIRTKDQAVMVYIKEGDFLLGAYKWNEKAYKSEKPQNRVFLTPYYMDKYEITKKKFQIFTRATGYKSEAEKKGFSYNWNGKTWGKILGLSPINPWPESILIPSIQNHPVTHISYNDANAYAKWVNAKLPTEAQWEKAARGKDGINYPWGQRLFPEGSSKSRSNYTKKNWKALSKDGYPYTAPVESFPLGVSPFGCFQMFGNVWEWCRDSWNSPFYEALKKHKKGTLKNPWNHPKNVKHSKYVIRGRGWTPGRGGQQITSRGRNFPQYTSGDLGFRCMILGVEKKILQK